MTLTFTKKSIQTADVITFAFEPSEPVTWRAGQFLEYNLPHSKPDSRGERRWFTNSAAPHEKEIRITTRFSEPCSSFKHALLNLEPGDTIQANPPEGDFVVDDPGLRYIFIAGGIGITPFRSIMADLHHRGEALNITLLYANRTSSKVVFKEEFDELAESHPEMDIHYIFDPQKITDKLVRNAVPALREPQFYVSGPEPMVESLGEMLLNIGIAKDHLKQDFFPNYTANL